MGVHAGAIARAASLVVICAALSGCVTPVPEQRSVLENTADCCKSMSEFKFAPLAMTDEKEVALGAESPAFTFQSGKSYFAAYRLPAWSAPYQIRAESQDGNTRGGLLSPSALLLDSDFRVVRSFNVATGPDATRPNVLHIFVNEADAAEQYLVLFTARASGGFNTLLAKPIQASMPNGMILPLGATESRVSMPYAPSGVLQVKVSPYQPQRAGQAARAE
jgi:hypothetical protein